MHRRSFLQSGSILSLPTLLGGVQVGVMTRSVFHQILDADDDRVLVLVQQNGGNDGLSTVIPLDQYSTLSAARPDILIPENQVLKLTDETGLHPVMGGTKALYDEGVLAIIQNVGYANQNRSHFRSTDIWDTGSLAEEVLATGWIGRYLDTVHDGYPENYPNQTHPHPIAITLGPSVSETCQGIAANFSLAINDPNALTMIPGTTGGELPDLPYGDELTFLRQIVAQTNEYAVVLSDAAELGANLSPLYPDPGQNSLADQLRIVAQLISGGLQTKIYVVNINGFDTHANQVLGDDSTTGIHAELLSNLSSAMHAFVDDLRMQGLDHRVIGATRSEFGRQISSNGSLGTDHGNAAPLLIFGSCVNGGITGPNPQIPSDVPRQAGVPTQIDFKDVFGSMLVDWFGVSQATVGGIFSHQFTYMPIINACSQTTPTQDLSNEKPYSLHAYPNPFFERLNVQFKTPGGHARVSLFNEAGQEIHVFTDRDYAPGEYTVEYQVPHLTPGHYYYKFQAGSFQETRSLLHF